MIPDFALHLSFEGISLLHRTAEGWASLGEVPLDSVDFGGDLVRLHKAGLGSGTPWRGTKVLLPPEQVRVVSLEGLLGEAEARSALEGLTPYAIADLVLDVVHHEGRTHVAAVARETLTEAENFADEHGFAPVSFAAALGAAGFPGEAFFGPTAAAAGILGDETVLRDPVTLASGAVALDPVDGDPGIGKPDEDPEPVVGTLAVEPEAIPDREQAVRTEQEIQAEPAVRAEPEVVVAAVEPLVVSPEPEPPVLASPPEVGPALGEEPPVQVPVTEYAPVPEQASAAQETPATVVMAAPARAMPIPEPVFASRSRPLSGQSPALGPAPQKASDQIRAASPGWALSAQPGGRPDPRLMPRAKTPPPSEATVAPAREPVRLEPLKPSRSGPFGSLEPKPKRERVGGKPRFLGLILTVILLILMAAAALFAAGPDRIAGLFRQAEPAALESSMISVEPEPAGPETAAEPVAPVTPGSVASAVAALPGSEAPAAPEGEDAAPRAVAAALPQPAGADAAVSAPTQDANEAASAAVAAAIAALPRPVAEQTPPEAAVDPAEAERVYASTGIWLRAPRVPALPEGGQAVAPDLPETSVAKSLAELPTLAAAGPDAPPSTDDGTTLVAEPLPLLPSRLPPTRPAAQLAPGPTLANALAEPPALRIPRRPVPPANVLPAPGEMTAATPVPWANAMAEAPAARIPSRPEAPPEVLAALAAAAPKSDAMASATAPAPLGGVGLTALRPDARPQPRPDGFSPELPEPEPIILASYDGPRPGARPDGLAPEDLPSADVSDALAEALAQPEPQPEAQPAPEAPAAPDLQSALAAIVQGAPDPLAGATRQAVASVRVPDVRPRNFGRVVESQLARQSRAGQAQDNRAPAGGGSGDLTVQEQAEAAGEAEVASSAAAAPSGPTATSVAQAATRADAIALREINLIGVYGQPGARRALVRMENGRYLRVGVGDELDGGQVTAIGDNALNYVRRGRTFALVIPGG